MDFNKINSMIDELNSTFSIVEENTKKIEAETMDGYKELFYQTHDYFVNWMSLFEKVRISNHNQMKVYPDKEHKHWIWIKYGEHYANIEYGTALFKMSVCPTYNPRYFEASIFPHWDFKDSVIPTIKAIDFDYVEKQMMDMLNEAIKEKAELIESNYNKAVNEVKGV